MIHTPAYHLTSMDSVTVRPVRHCHSQRYGRATDAPGPGHTECCPSPNIQCARASHCLQGRTHVLTCCSPSEVGPTLAFESRGRLRNRQADVVTLRVRSQRLRHVLQHLRGGAAVRPPGLMPSDYSDNPSRTLDVESCGGRLAVIQLAVVGREPRVANFSYRARDGLFLTSLVQSLFGYLAAIEIPAHGLRPPANPSIEGLSACGRVQIELLEVHSVRGPALLSSRLRQDRDCGT